jgi:hypothetical protein
MKGNIHKKLTFEDRTEKQWVRTDFKGWMRVKTGNRKLFRRRMDALCRQEYSADLQEDESGDSPQ